MSKLGQEKPLDDAVVGMNAGESRVELEKQLALHGQHLQELPASCDPEDRARVQLDIAETLLGLNRNVEAWEMARESFDVFISQEQWEEATECCDILYQSDQDHSIAALGNGVWLAITYPIRPSLSTTMLHHIVDETPDNSDGGAVAAMAAHYIAGLRTEGKEQENLQFLTAQIVAQVAKRHRGIEDEDSIKLWIDMLQLNDPQQLLNKLAKMLDVIVGNQWWIDRDALRAKLPIQ